MKRLTLALALVAAAGGTASAQSRKAADRVHDFHTLDRQTPMTTVGLSLGFESWDHPFGEPIDQLLTIDLSGQFVSESGAGAYVNLPLTYVSTQDVTVGGVVIAQGDSEMAIGNVEVGGLYAGRLGHNADMVVHGGVALPTADDDGVGLLGFEGAFVHLQDLADRYPNTTFLRAGISPMGRASLFFWRFDVGVDIRLDNQDDKVDISPIVHIGAGAGVDLGKAEVTGELANIIDNPDNDNTDDTVSTFAIGARFKAQNIQPGLAVIFPIGADDFDDFNFALAASITGRMP